MKGIIIIVTTLVLVGLYLLEAVKGLKKRVSRLEEYIQVMKEESKD